MIKLTKLAVVVILTLLIPAVALDVSWSEFGLMVGIISEIIGIWIALDKRFK